MGTAMDLAEFLKNEHAKVRSYRKMALHIGIAKTTVENIAKGRIRTMPEVETLQHIADAYGMTLPTVVGMAGAMLGDNSRYQVLARQMEAHPWLSERFDELTKLTEAEFQEAMDYLEWRKRHPASNPHLPDSDQSNP